MVSYSAVFTPSDGGYVVEFPDVPGCVTGDRTFEGALDLAYDALGGCLCAYEDMHVVLAAPRDPREIETPGNSFVVLVKIDLSAYRRELQLTA